MYLFLGFEEGEKKNQKKNEEGFARRRENNIKKNRGLWNFLCNIRV